VRDCGAAVGEQNARGKLRSIAKLNLAEATTYVVASLINRPAPERPSAAKIIFSVIDLASFTVSRYTNKVQRLFCVGYAPVD
jgi:hypothetical protein